MRFPPSALAVFARLLALSSRTNPQALPVLRTATSSATGEQIVSLSPCIVSSVGDENYLARDHFAGPLDWARVFAALLLGMVWLLTPNSLAAQITGTGTLTGRIYNPATKEYVRDAEIRVEGASIITSSESGGFYSLRQIPAGQVTVSVTYADYPKATQVVALLAGQTVERDFDLTPPAAPAQSRDGVVTLGAFVVSSEVEGQVKQIMNQRNSMNLGTSISSDVFGDVTEGNGNLFVAENYGGNWVFGVRGEF